ncbi:flagellar biosynthesis anti-sigma factor FlgM [Cycloclasticus sp.]|uniref:flagellar biosynthesis anti-sigma factor FlgM n=1 Tax=Cycloclasticus sp. TaxID=2024830 RepID=UPI000C0FE077|nr:flagellar biosynthesis anti-sigma factor FlgM [Cycloclasticus sp.]PHR48471.1 MAG: flagellar biosynthesis anti-sigma factor FlgM [Cycloclasticus sp.]
MPINIKKTGHKSAQSPVNKANNTKSSAKKATKTADSDSIDLTENASKLQQIEQSLQDIPVIDTGRVEAISQSIEEGQYNIDNEKIADRIIKSETALHLKKKSS